MILINDNKKETFLKLLCIGFDLLDKIYFVWFKGFYGKKY